MYSTDSVPPYILCTVETFARLGLYQQEAQLNTRASLATQTCHKLAIDFRQLKNRLRRWQQHAVYVIRVHD